MVRFLLEKGADPNITDKTGRTALEIAKHLKREKSIQILESISFKEKVEKKNDEIDHEIDFKNLIFKEKIGEGSFGEVWKGEYSCEEVAIKNCKYLKDIYLKIQRMKSNIFWNQIIQEY